MVSPRRSPTPLRGFLDCKKALIGIIPVEGINPRNEKTSGRPLVLLKQACFIYIQGQLLGLRHAAITKERPTGANIGRPCRSRLVRRSEHGRNAVIRNNKMHGTGEKAGQGCAGRLYRVFHCGVDPLHLDDKLGFCKSANRYLSALLRAFVNSV